MKEVVRLALVLFTICAVTSGSLAFVNTVTSERIEENEMNEAARLRAEALVGPDATVKLTDLRKVGDIEYFEGSVGGRPAGAVFRVATDKGYGGTIEILVGVDVSRRRIAGVRISSHSETPGLGARLTEVKPGENGPWFLDQFKGLTAERLYLKPKGKIDAITAATISSSAVTDAVRRGLEAFTAAGMSQKEMRK